MGEFLYNLPGVKYCVQLNAKVGDGIEYLTKATTCKADELLASPRNSNNACTTLAAISENLTAVT